MKDPMQSDRAHVCAQASGIDRHHGPGGLAEVALVARREEVVLRGGSSSSERHDVVDVQDDAGSAARATAVATAKTIALQNAEAHLRAGMGSRALRVRRPAGVPCRFTEAWLSARYRRSLDAGAGREPGRRSRAANKRVERRPESGPR
jgi:hypothetical protein